MTLYTTANVHILYVWFLQALATYGQFYAIITCPIAENITSLYSIRKPSSYYEIAI